MARSDQVALPQRASGALAADLPTANVAVIRWSYVLVACALMVVLGARGLQQSEITVSLQGDMPRYLMNGVFVHDAVRDHPLADPMGYAYRYYAHYPALSLGHHPPLLAVAEAPFFAVFGVSVKTGRVVILSFAVLAIMAWFTIVQRLYDDETAFVAALLLATTPFIVQHAGIVLSEIPALALMLLTVALCLRYVESLRMSDAIWFACAAGLSPYAKQHTVFIVPILFLYLVLRRGWRVLFRRETIVAGILILSILVPLVPLTLEFSRANVAWVRASDTASRLGGNNVLYYVFALWKQLVSPSALVLAGIGGLWSLWKRDTRVVLFLLWIVGFYLCLTFIGVHAPRYAIYWIPPFLGLAAAGLSSATKGASRAVIALVLVATILAQGWRAYANDPTYVDGYETAAVYVMAHPRGSVLYSANVDSGYFVFFVRKHDPDGKATVLRADKILATSSIGRIIEEQVHSTEEIYALLRELGVGYVVIEDAPYQSPALALLRTELQGPAFTLRQRIPLRTNHAELSGVDLAIYEYNDYQPARGDAHVRMRVPLMGRYVDTTAGSIADGKAPAPADTTR